MAGVPQMAAPVWKIHAASGVGTVVGTGLAIGKVVGIVVDETVGGGSVVGVPVTASVGWQALTSNVIRTRGLKTYQSRFDIVFSFWKLIDKGFSHFLQSKIALESYLRMGPL